jgi:hypothetical protein
MFGHATPGASVCQSVLVVGCAGMTGCGDGLKADAKASTRQADTGTAALPGLFFPLVIWPDIRTLQAADLANEARLDVGEPGTVRPSVAADRGPMAATEIRAIDQHAANPGGAHFSEGDFLGHALTMPPM